MEEKNNYTSAFVVEKGLWKAINSMISAVFVVGKTTLYRQKILNLLEEPIKCP